MNNMAKVYEFIAKCSPNRVGNHDVVNGTGIRPHQQVFQLTQKLLNSGQIRGQKFGTGWEFWVGEGGYSKTHALSKRPERTQSSVTNIVKPTQKAKLDFTDSLILVSCVKSKRTYAASAKDLYTSPLFTGMKNLAEASGSPWYILSAKYGLVDPDTKLDPYEFTLKTQPVTQRKLWAKTVLENLLPLTKGFKRIVIFAGADYREFLVEPFKQHGLEVVVPMEGLSFGKQLAWLAERT